MFRKTCLLLLLSIIVSCARAADFELILEDPDVFSACQESPPGAADINGLFDTSELVLSLDGDTVHVEGNVTTVWDVHPSDRIGLSVTMFHFERGVWEPTLFSMNSQSFCGIMYGTDQYWFKYWTKYVTNGVGSKCINTKGTKMVHDPFDLKMVFYNIRGGILTGRYKMILTMEAFDEKNVRRDNSICIEIKGDLEKV